MPQVKESTDEMDKCYLMGFVRLVQEEEVFNQFLFLED